MSDPSAPRVLLLESAAAVRRTMVRIGVDPVGIERMAAKAQWHNVLVAQLPCMEANILKQEMLALGGDAAVARGTVACSIAASDVLLMGSLKCLRRLSERLRAQPFALPQLGQRLEQLLENFAAVPTQLRGRRRSLDLRRPQVMAIINATPDSFYAGGRCHDLDSALAQVQRCVDAGADLLDIGGESTRPGAAPVAVEEELRRVIPLVEAVGSRFDLPLSVDTNKAQVAQAALESGADFINDISGLTFDAEMADTIAACGGGVFVMHTRARPQVMQNNTVYADIIGEICASLRHSVALAQQAGIPDDAIAVDPGIGFGKSTAGNLEIIRRLGEFRSLGLPILLGASRKSMIGNVLNQPDAAQRLYGSLATAAVAIANGAAIVRVHDVAETRQVVDMAWAIVNGCESVT